MDTTDRPEQRFRRSTHELWRVLFARAQYARSTLHRLQRNSEKLTLIRCRLPNTARCGAAMIAALDQLHALYRDTLTAVTQEEWRMILARWPAEPADLLTPGHPAADDLEPLTFTVLLRPSDPPIARPVISAICRHYGNYTHPTVTEPVVVDLDAAPRDVLDLLLRLVRIRDAYRTHPLTWI